jgi:putative transcriptional regulator
MANKTKSMSVFEQIKTGLEDCLSHAKGELTLATIRVPAPPPKANPRKIAALRRHLYMSQSVFAATLNVSTKTVQSWEQGLREPNEASLRLLQIIGSQPSVVTALFSEGPVSGGRKRHGKNSRTVGKAVA